MRRSDLWTLLALAAMWGASFMFMRIVAPVLGWAWAANTRVLLGAALIASIMLWQREPLKLRQDWRHFAVLGLINSALPFVLFAIAALYVPAAYSAVCNATAPLWGALLGSLFFADRLSLAKFTGLVLGISGVALTAGAGKIELTSSATFAIAGTLFAALLYAIAGVYMKRFTPHIKPLALGCGSQLAASLWLLPLLFFFSPNVQLIDFKVVLCVLGAGLISTGLPYVLYFPLMQRIGPMRALSVTFLVPCFAVFFAYVFLGEALSLGSLAGCGTVLIGLFLVLKK